MDTLFDFIVESNPMYKEFDLYVFDEIIGGYCWVGQVHNVFDYYSLELVLKVDPHKKAIYLYGHDRKESEI